MARMGPLFPRMHTAAFGDDVANGKPAPDIYLLVVERLGVAADRCLALKDSLPGVEAAERAGLTVILVAGPVQSHDGIRYVCGSLFSVRDWLAASGEDSTSTLALRMLDTTVAAAHKACEGTGHATAACCYGFRSL